MYDFSAFDMLAVYKGCDLKMFLGPFGEGVRTLQAFL